MLLLFQEPVNSGLLFRSVLEKEQHAIHGHVGGCRAAVELRARQGMGIALELGQIFLIHLLCDTRWSAGVANVVQPLCSVLAVMNSGHFRIRNKVGTRLRNSPVHLMEMPANQLGGREP